MQFAQVRCTEEKAAMLSSAAASAEEVASEAMTAAGAAVHDEMEAATVVRETQARDSHIGVAWCIASKCRSGLQQLRVRVVRQLLQLR